MTKIEIGLHFSEFLSFLHTLPKNKEFSFGVLGTAIKKKCEKKRQSYFRKDYIEKKK